MRDALESSQKIPPGPPRLHKTKLKGSTNSNNPTEIKMFYKSEFPNYGNNIIRTKPIYPYNIYLHDTFMPKVQYKNNSDILKEKIQKQFEVSDHNIYKIISDYVVIRTKQDKHEYIYKALNGIFSATYRELCVYFDVYYYDYFGPDHDIKRYVEFIQCCDTSGEPFYPLVKPSKFLREICNLITNFNGKIYEIINENSLLKKKTMDSETQEYVIKMLNDNLRRAKDNIELIVNKKKKKILNDNPIRPKNYIIERVMDRKNKKLAKNRQNLAKLAKSGTENINGVIETTIIN
jgi:regulator of replication initiation timing